MTTNPNDYNPDELRGGSSPSDEAILGGSGSPLEGGLGAFDGGDGRSADQYRELFLLERLSGETSLKKPYLRSLPQSYAAELLVFEWLEFLVSRAGFRRSLDVLRYYRSIEWITDEAENELREYLQSFDGGAGDRDLDRGDHLHSLVYIARLSAME